MNNDHMHAHTHTHIDVNIHMYILYVLAVIDIVTSGSLLI